MNRRDLLKQCEIKSSHITNSTEDITTIDLSDLHEGDKITITLDALVGDILFDASLMRNTGALVYLKLSHDSLWIDAEDTSNVIIKKR